MWLLVLYSLGFCMGHVEALEHVFAGPHVAMMGVDGEG